jgi:hypothetical protein
MSACVRAASVGRAAATQAGHISQLRSMPHVRTAGFEAAWRPTIGYVAMALLFPVMMYYYTKGKPAPKHEDLTTRLVYAA